MPITINGTTGISGVDGSAGTPAVIGSDADTGLVFAAGQVTASLNGTAANVALVSGTAQATTSGTAIDFTGIPSWVKRVTVMLNGVSLSATANLLVQIGSGSFTTSGYVSSSCAVSSGTINSTSGSTSTAGFISHFSLATAACSGQITLTNVTGNTWVASHSIGGNADARFGGGTLTLSGVLDRVRITSTSTDTFDAGSINILYE